MPPPKINMRLGTFSKAKAPVLSTTRGSSGMNGNRTAWLPAAMMQRLNATTFLAPVFCCPSPEVSSTSKWLEPTKEPYPRTVVTFRILAMAAKPPVSLPMTFSLWPRNLSIFTLGLPKSTPRSAMWLTSSITAATCSKALEGIHPTFKHTPPNVA